MINNNSQIGGGKYDLTEDEVRKESCEILGLHITEREIRSGTGQVTTFNQLGFVGIKDKPDGWYLPNDKNSPAIILECKNSNVNLGEKEKEELLKNCRIVLSKYKKVIGILFNGYDIIVYKNCVQVLGEYKLQNKEYYLSLFDKNTINKQKIYQATKSINDALHFGLTLKNLYHRMIFTACALVAKRYGAVINEDMTYDVLRFTIQDKLKHILSDDIKVNNKLKYLIERFDAINAETPNNPKAISTFVEKVDEIANDFESSYWNGEDVMAIFFNEFNRYKGKSESGQVFTPDHIASLMYRMIDVCQNDIILDAACGSGTFLVKSMCNMIKEAGGERTKKAREIKRSQLYGVEKDMEIYALACANMLIHKDGKTNIEHLDSRYEDAYKWIKSKNITKVLMNPPFESKYGCLDIVLNVLNAVADRDNSLHHLCAFILPDKKLEKKNQVGRVKKILSKHRLLQIVKLPERTFDGVNTSIFIFESGKPQGDKQIFGCYIKEDGLGTIKNQGRQDVYGNWQEIENYWIKVINREIEDETVQYINPKEHLSYQIENKIIISRSLFNATLIEYKLYHYKIDFPSFCENLSKSLIYQTNFPSEHRDIYDGLLKLARNYEGDVYIDSSDWKEFPLTSILIKIGRGERIRKQDRKEGDMPLVTAGYINQGVTEYINRSGKIIYNDVITIDMFGNSFFRDYSFVCDDNILVFKMKGNLHKECILFVVALLNSYSQRFGNRYNYDNQFRENNFQKEIIKLPVNSDGNPDWQFMEDYIKSLPYSANL